MSSKDIKGRYTDGWTSETIDSGLVKQLLGMFTGNAPQAVSDQITELSQQPLDQPDAPPDRPQHQSQIDDQPDLRSEIENQSPQIDDRADLRVDLPVQIDDQPPAPEKFSTTPADSAGVGPADSAGPQIVTPAESAGPRTAQPKGFLALPHALLDKILAEIKSYSAFKLYLYFYREAFRRVHDERLSAKCSLALATITEHCAMPDRVLRDALKLLVGQRWIEIANRPGAHNTYIVHRLIGPADSTGVGPADSAGVGPADSADDQRNDLKKKSTIFKNDDYRQKKGAVSVENHRYPEDDDTLPPIRGVYQELTGNTWTSKDTQTYTTFIETIKDFTFKAEDIIRCMRVIFERTNRPIGSFAYFAKAILKETQTPKNRKTSLDKLCKIVATVRATNVGNANYSSADFREDVKTAAARAGVAYPPDLLEQALRKQPQ